MRSARKFNSWYDSLREPWRFVLFITLLVPMVVASLAGHPGWCLAWMLMLAFVRAAGKREANR